MTNAHIFCHSCKETIEIFGEHAGHALEYVKEGKEPTLGYPQKLVVCYNIWDVGDYWLHSLMSIREVVDKLLLVIGPYKYYGDFDHQKVKDIKKLVHKAKTAGFIRDTVQIEYKVGTYETQVEKRTDMLSARFYEPGDWILMLDDDEVLYQRTPYKLKDIIMFSMAHSLRMHRRTEFAKFQKDNLGGIKLILTQQGLGKSRDIITYMRLIKWQPNMKYQHNHHSIFRQIPDGERKLEGKEADYIEVTADAVIWGVDIIHVQPFRSLDRQAKRMDYYKYRHSLGLENE